MKPKMISRASIYLILVLIVLIVGLILLLNIRANASQTGLQLGQSAGTVTGKAIGSLKGITTGRSEGAEAGKQAGQSAEDTHVEIKKEFELVNKLDVLVVSIKEHDIQTDGPGDNPNYKALYVLHGDLVFSVDLSKASVSPEEDVLNITLPEPEGELFFDQSQFEKIAEFQQDDYTGSTQDGYIAALNSRRALYQRSVEELSNYDTFLKEAKDSAESQVRRLVESVTLKQNTKINITWRENGGTE